MTLTASIVYMFFAVHLIIIQTPPTPIHQPHRSAHKKVATTHQKAPQTQNVAATQTITTTKESKSHPNNTELYHRVAARSLGEGSSALPEIACTVKNRLRVSGSPLSIVLKAYF